MISNETALAYYYNMHQSTNDIFTSFAFIVGAILGAFVIAILIDLDMKRLRMTGRRLSKFGVYTFTEHTPETLKEYLEYRNKEKKLS